jgi:hypothetical protein
MHFAAVYQHYKHMHGESASTYGYHSSNVSVTEGEDDMEEAAIGDLANLEMTTLTYRNVVTALTEANSNPHLVKHLEERSAECNTIRELLKKELTGRKFECSCNYCWYHG